MTGFAGKMDWSAFHSEIPTPVSFGGIHMASEKGNLLAMLSTSGSFLMFYVP